MRCPVAVCVNALSIMDRMYVCRVPRRKVGYHGGNRRRIAWIGWALIRLLYQSIMLHRHFWLARCLRQRVCILVIVEPVLGYKLNSLIQVLPWSAAEFKFCLKVAFIVVWKLLTWHLLVTWSDFYLKFNYPIQFPKVLSYWALRNWIVLWNFILFA